MSKFQMVETLSEKLHTWLTRMESVPGWSAEYLVAFEQVQKLAEKLDMAMLDV